MTTADPLFPPDVIEGMKVAHVRWSEEAEADDLAWDSSAEMIFCPYCGSCDWWWTADDVRRCARCQPPITSNRMVAKRAVILRKLQRGRR